MRLFTSLRIRRKQGLKVKLPRTLLNEPIHKAAKKPMDLFPRVPRTDVILFEEQCHGQSYGKMCFLSPNGVQDDSSHDQMFVAPPIEIRGF